MFFKKYLKTAKYSRHKQNILTPEISDTNDYFTLYIISI